MKKICFLLIIFLIFPISSDGQEENVMVLRQEAQVGDGPGLIENVKADLIIDQVLAEEDSAVDAKDQKTAGGLKGDETVVVISDTLDLIFRRMRLF